MNHASQLPKIDAASLEREFFSHIQTAQNALQNLPWERSEVYWSWLSQTSHFVDWTTRLITLAAGCCTLKPTSREFHSFLVHHLREEFNHDQIALEDLSKLRERYPSLPQVRQVEFAETASFHQTLRTQLMKGIPYGEFALLGRMLFLEGLAAGFGPKLASEVERHHGESCGRFISLHGQADQEHLREDLALLKNFESAQLELIQHELRRTARLYADLTSAWQRFASTTHYTDKIAG